MSLVERVPTENSPLPADLYQVYMRETHHVDQLSQEEEICLAQQIEFGNIAREILQDETAVKELSPAAIELLNLDASWGESAYDHLVEGNLRLVVSHARRFYPGSVPLLDLIQVGNLGLMKAATNYDWRRPQKFSTYAREYILGSIKKELRRSSSASYVAEETLAQCMELEREELSVPAHDVDDEALCQKIGISAERLEELRRANNFRRPLSTQHLQDEGKSIEAAGYSGASSADEFAMLDSRLFINSYKEAMLAGHITPRDLDIFLAFTLGEVSGPELAKKHALTRAAINLVVHKVIAKSKVVSKATELVEYS